MNVQSGTAHGAFGSVDKLAHEHLPVRPGTNKPVSDTCLGVSEQSVCPCAACQYEYNLTKQRSLDRSRVGWGYRSFRYEGGSAGVRNLVGRFDLSVTATSFGKVGIQ